MNLLLLNKRLLKPVIQVFLFVNVLLIISCSDDTVTPLPPVNNTTDTIAMFEWDLDTISGYFLRNIYVADSNNIYFEGPGANMVYYNGKDYLPINYNDPAFSSICISGFNQNCVIIGGGRDFYPNPPKPSLKVWNGSGFSSYEFPNDTGESFLSVYVSGYNQAWLQDGFHNIYYFNNGNFTRYYVDSLLGGGDFYISPNNYVYLFSGRSGSPYHSIYIGYKLVNNNFQIIYRDSVTAYSNLTRSYFPCKSFILGGGYRAINIFNNDYWSLLYNTLDFYPDRVCATSIDTLICYGERPYGWQDFYLWHRGKWVIEKTFYDLNHGLIQYFPEMAEASQMFLIDNKIYLNFHNYDRYSSYLLKGKPIQRKEAKK